MTDTKVEQIESIRDVEAKGEAGPKAVEKLSPEKVLGTARETIGSVRNWVKETSSKLSESLNAESAGKSLSDLIDNTNGQIESAFKTLTDRVNRIIELPFSKDLSEMPADERERILQGVERDIRVGARLGFGDKITDNFDFGGTKYRITPEVQERLSAQVQAREAMREANFQEQDVLLAEQEKRQREKIDELNENQKRMWETSKRKEKERAEKTVFEEESYKKFRAAHFENALEAQGELLKIEIEEHRQGKRLDGEALSKAVQLGLRSEGVDRPPIPGQGGEPTDEEVERIRGYAKKKLSPQLFREYLRHFNKARLQHDVFKHLEKEGGTVYNEWRSRYKNRSGSEIGSRSASIL